MCGCAVCRFPVGLIGPFSLFYGGMVLLINYAIEKRYGYRPTDNEKAVRASILPRRDGRATD